MLGPNHHTYHLASETYNERLTHAARIRMVQQDRQDGTAPANHEGHRLLTARRLATGLAGVVLASTLIAGTVAGVAASPSPASGGGITLIR